MDNKFSENFRALREQKGLRQKDVADFLCTTQRKISYWEQEKIEPDLNMLIKIADFFEVSIDYLLGRKDY